MCWKNLPIEGRKVTEIAWGGYGKRGQFEITLEGPEETYDIPGSHMKIELSLQGKWDSYIKASDDVTVIHSFSPREPMVLSQCLIEFDFGDEKFDELVDKFKNGRWEFSHYGINRLKVQVSPG